MTITGQCLCGLTKVSLSTEKPDGVILCHCNDCKQTSGSAFSVNILVPEKDVKFEGSVKTYDSTAASGNTVSRIFCGSCGAALSHNSAAFGDSQAIQVGVFPELYELPVKAELFSKDRAFGLVACKGADCKETA